MGLVDSFTEIATTGGTIKNMTFTKAVPAGRLVVLAIGRGGTATAVSTIGTVRGNTWTNHGFGAYTGSGLNVTLLSCYVTTPIQVNDTFNITYNSTTNRWASVYGIFDNVVSPINSVGMAAPLSSSKANVDVGPTSPALAVNRALVVTAVASTGGGFPIVNRGNRIVGQVVTAGGSAERMVALLCKEEGGHLHTGSLDIPSSVISVATTAAFQVNPLPAGSIPLMTSNGEVPAALSKWNGTTETPIASLTIA